MNEPRDAAATTAELSAARDDAGPSSEPASVPASEQTLRRIEAALQQLRGIVESVRREESYQSFSAALIVAVVLQLVVVALAISALIDWVFQGPMNQLIIKLSFAAFLQICTLTAVVAAQRPRP
ncbi:MAG: hypothetical protein JNG88_14115 [Phycisphaerales bacterium]|nr:hypothetical protein [Phycisphaerales bacterium]